MHRTVLTFFLTQLLFTSFSIARFSSAYSSVHLVNSGSDIFSDGTVYRIQIDQTGIYSISGQWLYDQTDMESGTISYSDISLYGIFGGPLKHDTNFDETERLIQLAFQIIDNGNNILENGDQLRFYAEGSDSVQPDESHEQFDFSKNAFFEYNYIFLKIGDKNTSLLIKDEEDVGIPLSPTPKYWFAQSYHDDITNLLDNYISTQGSGQDWYGRELTNIQTIQLNDQFKIPVDGLSDVAIESHLAARSAQRESISMISGEHTTTEDFSPVNTDDIEALYARKVEITTILEDIGPNDPISLEFIKSTADSRVWLDYMTIQGWAISEYTEGQISFNNLYATNFYGFDGLLIESKAAIDIWDVSDPYKPVQKKINATNQSHVISVSSDIAESFIAFVDFDLFTPIGAEKVLNKDIIADGDVDMIIVCPELLTNSAIDLQQHRLQNDGITSLIVDPQSIYDVYSSGKVDPTAIRNYVRELYRTHARFKFLLLFGDASFDYRHINENHPPDNLVPTFETFNSLDPLLSFPSDDYYAMLDDEENGNLRGDLDIAIGRIPVSNTLEAEGVVKKIISYDQKNDADGAWKTRVVFLADDEDNNLHINDADVIASELARNEPLINQEKIYFDAFRQESTPGGNRYPSANEELNRTVEEGALVINYLGHGGPNGWAQERVLKIDDINNWNNFDRLPLIVTATCSFTGFDDPSLSSAGEEALLKTNGGALALFTTVRSVFASKNFQLTRSVFRELFKKEDGAYLRIGEIMRRSKNDNPNDNTNARKFFLIGDPSIRLDIPSLEIKTDEINGVSLENNPEPVSLSALDEVQLKGSIRSYDNHILNDYNGIVELFVYDKPSDVSTFGNDQRSFIKSFKTQQNIIYQGSARVTNGIFQTSFVIPVDIDYSVGNAKISYFSTDKNGQDGAGYTENLIIGGPSIAPVQDNTGPLLKGFLNNRSFINGDKVPSSNIVLVDLSDDHGINISNAAIGHEITAVVDSDSKSTLFLNKYFRSNPEDPKGGTLQFELLNLEKGMHSLRIRAFDVANNVGETTLDFEVSEEINKIISNVTFTPNPFRDNTNFEIKHNLLDGLVLVTMEVYDSMGKIVERPSYNTISRNGLISLEWTPNRSANGIFVCHFSLISLSTGESTESYSEKVVVLK